MSESLLPEGSGNPRWDHPPRRIAPRTRLFGRNDDLDRLEQMLADPSCRLVTVTGPGGVGKNRLSLALAERPAFADRTGFVALADVQDAALIPATILRSLGLEALPGQSVEEVVISSLADRNLLLVLDNLEHLPGATVISTLLSHCPELQILATSRIPLGISGEQRYSLAPLEVPGPGSSRAIDTSSEQLFIDRVRLVLPSFQLTPGTTGDIKSICQQLDGMPLAIELAAAHCRQLSPHSLAERLRQRPLITVAGPRDAPSRQQTMQATVLWSVNLLEPQVARLWRALGVFEGGFTLEAAEAVAGVIEVQPSEVAGMLDQLEMHDLVRLGSNGLGEPRYHMLRITREVALDALQSDPGYLASMEAHAGVYERFCTEAEPGLMGTDSTSWFTRVEAEVANIRAVMNRDLAAGDSVRPLVMAARLHWFWTDPGYLREGLGWLSMLLERADDDTPVTIRMAALSAASSVADWLDDQDAALVFASQGLSLARETGDQTAEMQMMLHLGNIHLDVEDLERADRYFQEGHDLAQQIQDAWCMPAFANLRATVAAARSDAAGAAAWHRTAIAGWRASGHDGHLLIAEAGLAVALVELGELSEAVLILLDNLSRMGRDAIAPEATMAIAAVAAIAIEVDMPVLAVRFLAAATHLRQEMGVEFRPYFNRILALHGERLRSEMSPPVFSRAWSEGSARSLPVVLDEAIAFLAELPPRLGLSARELDVLRLLAEGASDSEIAERLYISRHTASKHVAAILEKLDAPNRTTAVAIAYRRGLVLP